MKFSINKKYNVKKIRRALGYQHLKISNPSEVQRVFKLYFYVFSSVKTDIHWVFFLWEVLFTLA